MCKQQICSTDRTNVSSGNRTSESFFRIIMEIIISTKSANYVNYPVYERINRTFIRGTSLKVFITEFDRADIPSGQTDLNCGH